MAMIKFEDYSRKYTCVKMERRDGILQMTLHTKGAELQWGISGHEELSYAFYDIARDHENRCVILTGSGAASARNSRAKAAPAASTSRARVAITQHLKQMMLENLGYGLALEGLGAVQSWPGALPDK
jgi:enoyl-CoA hydratase/carnithine racemase